MIGQFIFTGFIGPGEELVEQSVTGIESIAFEISRNVISVTKEGKTQYYSVSRIKNIVASKLDDDTLQFIVVAD